MILECSLGNPSWKALLEIPLGNISSKLSWGILGKLSWKVAWTTPYSNYLGKISRDSLWELAALSLGKFPGRIVLQVSLGNLFSGTMLIIHLNSFQGKLSWETIWGNSFEQLSRELSWKTLLEHFPGSLSLKTLLGNYIGTHSAQFRYLVKLSRKSVLGNSLGNRAWEYITKNSFGALS